MTHLMACRLKGSRLKRDPRALALRWWSSALLLFIAGRDVGVEARLQERAQGSGVSDFVVG